MEMSRLTKCGENSTDCMQQLVLIRAWHILSAARL